MKTPEKEISSKKDLANQLAKDFYKLTSSGDESQKAEALKLIKQIEELDPENSVFNVIDMDQITKDWAKDLTAKHLDPQKAKEILEAEKRKMN